MTVKAVITLVQGFFRKIQMAKEFRMIREIPIVQSPNIKSTNKLNNITETRPKVCPRCRTDQPANISRTREERWKCKTCEYQW